MSALVCPHCKSQQIVTSRTPKDVVVVMPCPACGELTVLFRNKAIALDRQVIERGTSEERVNHLAYIINQFLESGLFPLTLNETSDFEASDAPRPRRRPRRRRPRKPEPESEPAISEEEFDRFVRFDLQKLDDPGYFRRHFG